MKAGARIVRQLMTENDIAENGHVTYKSFDLSDIQHLIANATGWQVSYASLRLAMNQGIRNGYFLYEVKNDGYSVNG